MNNSRSISRGGTILGLTALGHFINDGNMWLIPGIVLPILSEMGINYAIIGLLASLYALVSALASPLVPLTIKWSGGHMRAMSIGMLLWGLAIGIVALGFLTHTLYLTYTGIILSGVAAAYYHPVGSAVLSHEYGGNAGLALGINGAFGSLGRSLYPLLASIAVFSVGAIVGFNLWIFSLVAILLGVAVLLYSVNYFDVDPPTRDRGSMAYARSLGVSIGLIVLLTVITMLRNMVGQGVQTFIGIYLNKNLHISLGVNYGVTLAVVLSSAIIGQPLLGWLSDRIGRRLMASLSTFAFAIFFILFIYTGNLIMAFFSFMFLLSNFPLIMAVVGDLFPRELVGWATSIVWNVAVTGGNVAGSLLTGLLAQYYSATYGQSLGLEHAMLVVSALAFVSGVLWVFIPKPPKRSKIPLFS
ncbi:MAG: MFS transporter [Caldivirga sp.]|uniref:MFS transporter n=1 Tax=Caldivirga sp. TaxID=2080243 RepID=UPI003D0964F1